MSRQAEFCKRAMDFGLAAIGLALLSPLLLLIACIVKFDSEGPILFRQKRMGRNFRPFEILKFRTMVNNAERFGGQITATGDPRVTHSGRLLRKTKLDELPQLINILRGEMSIVGPRPEVPRYVELFREDFQQILSVRPGLTDFASIRYRNESQQLCLASNPEQEYTTHLLPEKIELAKEYIRRSSFALDLALIFCTLWSLVRTR